VAVGFVASTWESVGRLAEGYLGLAWLGPFNNAAYFPVVLISFGTLGVWLWKQGEATATKDITGEHVSWSASQTGIQA
jgi:hypothetical protein